ncbi:3-oxoacid CoA-transferase subunit B [Neobacillus drentensis]
MSVQMNSKELIAKHAAKELYPSSVVNLGIGIPTLVAKYADLDKVFLHTENGMLGVKEIESEEEIDPSLVNAGKLPISEHIGASYFDSAESFAMIRGGHIDIAILGALQVDGQCNIANWAIPGQNILGVGGAMDLLSGVKKVIITTNHTDKNGKSKVVSTCNFPVSAIRKLDILITDLAVFENQNNRLVLTELMPGATLEEVKVKTEASFEVSEQLICHKEV